MYFVYVIQSLGKSFQYVGSTNNIDRRLKEHNDGLVQSTKHYLPFKLRLYIAVETEQRARELEKYFKTGSGAVVLKKRLLGENL